ncbi:MAG: DUF4258 domain-containing protein [Flavobacteriaceae bacterium]|tara:strand:- start:374 stop:742 length:369 start_codon:yes stop_codon:yes gene_type:complete
MSFLYRLSYYLIGFTIGILFLMFFFSGKKTSCNYFPSKRVKNELLKKKIIIPNHFKEKFIFLNDSLLYSQINLSEVIFSKSNLNKKDTCKVYRLELKESLKKYEIDIKNCSNKIFLKSYQFN